MTDATAQVQKTTDAAISQPANQVMIAPTGDPIMDMAQRASANNDIGMVKELLAIVKSQKLDAAVQEFNAAYSKAQSELPSIPKRGTGNNSTKYARIEDIMQGVMPVLAKHGLSLRHKTENPDGKITVTAILAHVNGHSETDCMTASPDTSGSKNAIQAIKSAITYMRRTTAENILGLASHGEDDDAFAAADTELMAEFRTRIGEANTGKELDKIRSEIMTGKLSPQDRTAAGHVWTAKNKTVKREPVNA